MRNTRLILILASMAVLFCLSVSDHSASAQTRSQIEKNIATLNEQIAQYEKQINSIRSDKKSAQMQVNKLSNLISKRRKLLSEVNSQMAMINTNIGALTLQVETLEKQKERLRGEYAEMVRVAYRNYRQYNFLTYLFSAADFNSATRRIAALRLVNKARERKVVELDSLQRTLDESITVLDAEKADLASTRSKYNSELNKLSADERSYKKQVSQLSAREKKVLKAQQEQQRELERLVNATRQSKGGSTIGGNIKDNRGRLPIPVSGGRLKRNGNDIAEITGSKGAAVTAAFNGEVMQVTYNRNLKSYIVLIGHGNYFTTYSNMATATVREGQKVSVGQTIGTVGRSVDSAGKTEYKLVFGIFSPNGETLPADEWLRH